MDVLRIATAGSVDDGKSTLIGRLLHDTKSLTKDKLEAITVTSKRKGWDFTDLSLLTDGLIEEREQGITIDVANIYFSTPNRKYIIADTPGLVEYTRNMITGASNAQVSIILIDARNGIIEQTKRHLFISSLLKIETVFVCVNKMDLVNFDEEIFNSIQKEFIQLSKKIGFEGDLHFVPIAARDGDNVVENSARTPWYKGSSLLHLLEELSVHAKEKSLPARLPVQYVIRPHNDEHHDFRGYAGRLKTGTLQKGKKVVVLPSLKESAIKSLSVAEKPVEKAFAGESVVIELEEDIDVSRGNMIVDPSTSYHQVTNITATLSWMEEQPLTPGKTFLLQHNTNRVKAKLVELQNVLDIKTMEEKTDVAQLKLNDIGRVVIKTAKPIFADTYQANPENGSFILIDEFSNNTVAIGFIESF
ncbi:MAG: sulfate adenylyltransferase subunit 1 [Ginsengibacter sp.]